MGMGYIHLNCGRLDEAREPIEEGLSRGVNEVNDFMYALTLVLKGMLLFQTGDLESGMRLVEDALQIQKQLQDCEGGGIALSFLGQMHFARGNMARARELYDESMATFTRVGDRPEMARVYCEMGWTALAETDADAAQQAFCLAVQAYEEVGSARGTGLALLGLAAVEVAAGHSERAVTIAAAAHALAERAGVVCDHPMDPGVAQRIENLKASIPPRELDGLESSASRLTPAEVLAMFV